MYSNNKTSIVLCNASHCANYPLSKAMESVTGWEPSIAALKNFHVAHTLKSNV